MYSCLPIGPNFGDLSDTVEKRLVNACPSVDPVRRSESHKQVVSFVEALLNIIVSELDEPSLSSSCAVDTSRCELPVGLKGKGLAVQADQWLMNYGASLDRVNKASITKRIRGFIESCALVVLDAANGESIADQSINLPFGVLRRADCSVGA